jgi:hypothetical protein
MPPEGIEPSTFGLKVVAETSGGCRGVHDGPPGRQISPNPALGCGVERCGACLHSVRTRRVWMGASPAAIHIQLLNGVPWHQDVADLTEWGTVAVP